MARTAAVAITSVTQAAAAAACAAAVAVAGKGALVVAGVGVGVSTLPSLPLEAEAVELLCSLSMLDGLPIATVVAGCGVLPGIGEVPSLVGSTWKVAVGSGTRAITAVGVCVPFPELSEASEIMLHIQRPNRPSIMPPNNAGILPLPSNFIFDLGSDLFVS